MVDASTTGVKPILLSTSLLLKSTTYEGTHISSLDDTGIKLISQRLAQGWGQQMIPSLLRGGGELFGNPEREQNLKSSDHFDPPIFKQRWTKAIAVRRFMMFRARVSMRNPRSEG